MAIIFIYRWRNQGIGFITCPRQPSEEAESSCLRNCDKEMCLFPPLSYYLKWNCIQLYAEFPLCFYKGAFPIVQSCTIILFHPFQKIILLFKNKAILGRCKGGCFFPESRESGTEGSKRQKHSSLSVSMPFSAGWTIFTVHSQKEMTP